MKTPQIKKINLLLDDNVPIPSNSKEYSFTNKWFGTCLYFNAGYDRTELRDKNTINLLNIYNSKSSLYKLALLKALTGTKALPRINVETERVIQEVLNLAWED